MAQGQETQEAYKFPQKGWVLDNLFDTLLSWLSGGSLSAGSFSTSGEVTANGHNLTQKANKSEVDSAINTINGTLALKANTTDVNNADSDIIARLQGVKSDYNINDPILRKNFDTADALNSYLSTLHGNSLGTIPHGLVWLDLQGSRLWLFNSPKSYADDIWIQFLIGGQLLSNGQISNGNDILIRECSNGTWQAWKRLVNHKEVISTIEAQSLTEAQKAQVRANIGTDEAPTYNSQNLVKSGGVKSAIDYAYNNSVGVRAQSFSKAQQAQARTNISAASQSALNSTNQEVAKKTEVIDLKQYIGTRVPTCDYEFMKNYMPYYTYGEYPVQMGIVVEPNKESNNDFYYVGRYTSDNGVTFGYLSFSNKGDWGFRGGNQGFFTEANVPEALKQAIYAYGLSKETVYDAQPATLANHPVRTVKEGGTIVFPVSHSGAIFHDTNEEITVFEEIEALKVTQAFNVSYKEAVNKFVKELYVYDDDRQSGDEYYVVWVQRNLNGVYKFQLNKRRNGTPSTFLVWEKPNYTEASYIELLYQAKGFKAIVDWNAITNGTTIAPDATLRSFVFDLNFSPTILSKDKLDSITQEQFDAIFNFD